MLKGERKMMRINERTVAMLFVLTLLMTSLVFVQVSVGQVDYAYIDPPEIYASFCEDFTVTVIADVTYRIDWFGFWLNFDPTQMSGVDVIVLPPWITEVFEIGPNYVWVRGYSYELIGPRPIELAEIRFHCDAPGKSELYFEFLWVRDEMGFTQYPPTKGALVTQFPEFYWKASYLDYAQSGVPDFDQRQDAWVNPDTLQWSWCGPVAVANSLWWMDSRFETSTTPPPTISDTFPLVQPYGPWDDHDVKNVVPFISDLAWLMDTDGQRTGIPHDGTNVFDMQAGIAQYLIKMGVNPQGDANGDGITSGADAMIVSNAMFSAPGDPNWDLRADLVADNFIDINDMLEVAEGFGKSGLFYEKTVKMPSFEYIEWEIERCEDVILLLGFWEDQGGIWKRVGGHFVTSAGVNSPTRQIAWSDPIDDRAEALGMGPPFVPVPHDPYPHAPNVHNDAQFVSHDPYQAGPSPSPGGIWGPEEYYVEDFKHLLGENLPPEFIEYAAEYQGGPIFYEVEYAVIISPTGEWYWKHDLIDYAPSGVPDFDQRQDEFINPWGPNPGSWSWCGPTAVANSLWWLDSDKETSTTPPPTISDTYPLVQPFGPWDDHDPSNVVPLISYLGWLMDTDGTMTQLPHCGTDVYAMEEGIRMYLEEMGLDRKYTEETVVRPEFEYIEEEFERCEDVVLLLGFWQQDPDSGAWWRIGGHYVTVAGVDSEGYRIAFSDPYRDHAEQGYPGIVIPPEDHGHTGPPEDIHNDAEFVSHDIYNVAPSPSPGGIWGIPDYIPGIFSEAEYELVWNFVGSNFPEELMHYYWDYIMVYQPVYTEIEYAVIVSPVCPTPVVAAGSEDGYVYVYDPFGNLLWSYGTEAYCVSVALDNEARYLAGGWRYADYGALAFFDVNAVTDGGWNDPLWYDDSIAISESFYWGNGLESMSVDVKYNSYNEFYIVAAAHWYGLNLYDEWGDLIWQYFDEIGPETIVRISQDGNYIVCADSYNSGMVHYFSHLRDGVPGWGPGDGTPIWSFGYDTYPFWPYWIAISGIGDYVAVSGWETFEGCENVILLNRTGGIVWSYIGRNYEAGANTKVDMPCHGRSVVAVTEDVYDWLGCDLLYFDDGGDGWDSGDGTPVWTYWPGKEVGGEHDVYDDFYTVSISGNGDVISAGGYDGYSYLYVLSKSGTVLDIIEDGETIQSVDLTFNGRYTALGTGEGYVALYDKDISNWTWAQGVGYEYPIRSVAISKIYPCMFPFPNHDVDIHDVSPRKGVVFQEFALKVNVTISNEGDFPETANVKLWVQNSTHIFLADETNFAITPGSLPEITLEWDTTGFAKGSYTLFATISIIYNEIDVYDNNLVDGTAIVSFPGDLTGSQGVPDGKVDIDDVVYVALRFGTYLGHPNWDPLADITDDDKVDIDDVVYVALRFGTWDP